MSIASSITHTIHADSLADGRPLWRLYLELGKARLSSLVVVTTAVGYLLAESHLPDKAPFTWTILGTALTAAAANALNQCLEVHRDRRMERTRHRPLPSGAMTVPHAFTWALALAVAGLAMLSCFVNLLTAALGLLTLLVYVLLYTPLKPRTSLNTLVGAVCGAIPPMMGWTAAVGRIDLGAWILAAILFVWQIPHFLALAWLYRDDYARGGFRMLPIIDPTGRLTTRVILLYSLALIPIALSLTLIGAAGLVYAIGSLALGGLLLTLSVALGRRPINANARRLFLASLVYLSLLLVLMVADRTVPDRPPSSFIANLL